jgi:hypothetical protein
LNGLLDQSLLLSLAKVLNLRKAFCFLSDKQPDRAWTMFSLLADGFAGYAVCVQLLGGLTSCENLTAFVHPEVQSFLANGFSLG